MYLRWMMGKFAMGVRSAAALAMFLLAVIFSTNARAQFSSGQAASLAIGQKNLVYSGDDDLDSMGIYQPFGVAVDPTNGQVYVADTYNNRVLRYASASSFITGDAAIGVLGQPGFHSSQRGYGPNGMNEPFNVVVDALGNLYVSDTFNNRVLKFSHVSAKANGADADTVLGQPNFFNASTATAQNGFDSPQGLAVDASGDLFVADNANHRVMIFFAAASKGNGGNADLELGEKDFASDTEATTQSHMEYPAGVAVDTSGNLYVADQDNSRVLRFARAILKANGADADGVLGQPDFITADSHCSQGGMNEPTGVAVDRAGNLFVADGSNSRVLKFSHAASKANGANAANADTVFGQTNFSTNTGAASRNGMVYPVGLAIDTAEHLYVADFNNNRVLRFDNAAMKGNGANADAVLGHSTYTEAIANNLDSTGLNEPSGLAVDPKSGALYVVDYYNNRVLRYASALTYSAGQGAIAVLGQPDLRSNEPVLGPNGMYEPSGAAVDTAGNLYVADQLNNRVLIFLKASLKANGAAADIVLGEPNANASDEATT